MTEMQLLNAMTFIAVSAGNRVVKSSSCSKQKTEEFLSLLQKLGIPSREKANPAFLSFVAFCAEDTIKNLSRNKENKKVRVSSEAYFNELLTLIENDTQQERFQSMLDSPVAF